MRLSITDKFLLDVCNSITGAADILDFLAKPPTMRNWLPDPKNPIYKKYRSDRNKRKLTDLIYSLKRRGYIKSENLQGKKALLLTKKGISRALKASFFSQEMKMRKDRKWIMIIFDIPQRHKKARNLLRSILVNLGYKMFQQSVWVSPYDISEKTEKLLQFYSLDNYVKIFLIEEI